MHYAELAASKDATHRGHRLENQQFFGDLADDGLALFERNTFGAQANGTRQTMRPPRFTRLSTLVAEGNPPEQGGKDGHRSPRNGSAD